MPLSRSEAESRAMKLGQFFKPATPINREDLFAGRISQRRDLIDAINQNGQHAILYGERGVGKTSLANMLFPKLVNPSMIVVVPTINCTTQDDFSAIWRRVFEEIMQTAANNEQQWLIDEDVAVELSDYIQNTSLKIAPDAIRRLLDRIGKSAVLVIILDEFDTIANNQTRQTMADTIKYLSDRNVSATVVIIGVSDDVESLIENHRSIERCLVQVRMPRMPRNELKDIVTKCLKLVDLNINTTALCDIARLSRGLPHYAHLLGLHSGRAALDRLDDFVQLEDVSSSISTAINKAQASIQAEYRKATSSARSDAIFKHVLLACAMAHSDEFGYFSPVDLKLPLTEIRGKPYDVPAFAKHLHEFSSDKRGCVLKTETIGGRPRFRFMNPLTQPYILLRGVSDGMITEEQLRKYSDENGDGEDTSLLTDK